MNSIRKSDVENKLIDFCESIIEPLGYRPVDLECRLGGRSTLRVFIENLTPKQIEDSETVAQGISLDDCVKISQVLSPALDTQELVNGPYDLEVSSPGLDRRLRLDSDFKKAIGKLVKLKLAKAVPGVGSSVRGTVEGIEGTRLRVKRDGQEIQLDLQDIKRGNLVWEG